MEDHDLTNTDLLNPHRELGELIPFLEKEYGIVFQKEKEKLFDHPDAKFMTKLARRHRWRDRLQQFNFILGVFAGGLFIVQYFAQFSDWPNMVNYLLLAIVIMALASGIGKGVRSLQKKEFIIRLLLEINKRSQKYKED